MRRWRGRRLTILAGCLTVAAGRAAAQTPGPPPSPATLSGVVRDVTGAPIPDAEIRLIDESFVARSDTAGRFVLRGIPPGGHVALFRRIGYRSVEYRWAARPNREIEVSVVLTPVPRPLDRVVVEAPGPSRHRGTSSISGTLVDSAGRPVADADVRLLGAGLTTVADSLGRFEFRLLAAGSYMVRVRRVGLAPITHVIQIVDDDHRGITLTLRALPSTTRARDIAAASGYGVSDLAFEAFDRRARAGGANPVLGPGALFRANRVPLDFLLEPYRDRSAPRRRPLPTIADRDDSVDDGDCLLIDGRRAIYQPLWTFTSQEVQLVEVLRSTTLVDEFIESAMNGVRECRGTTDHHPTYFMLWTRALR
jgi:Carboxypeptidase regulatory-like domain